MIKTFFHLSSYKDSLILTQTQNPQLGKFVLFQESKLKKRKMEGASDDNGLGNSTSVEITGQIMVIAIIVLFVVVVFIMFLHLYAKWFWWRIEQPPEPSPSGRRRGRRRSRFVFAPGQDPAVTLLPGLNPAVLGKIPVVAFNSEEFKDGLECAVCLCELEDGEKARLLPKCNHGFHVECIDMWFQSHSSCPLCRNPVDVSDESAAETHIQDSQDSLESGYSTESSPNNFPTNVLFWGNETQVSSGGACLQEGVSSSSTSSGTRMLVIDIPPSNMSDQLSSLSPEEESKLPSSTRLRSLKRLLSRDKRVSPCNSGSGSGSGTSSSCDVV